MPTWSRYLSGTRRRKQISVLLLLFLLAGFAVATQVVRSAFADETCHPDAPATLGDYVHHGSETFTRVACNADAAVYFDPGMSQLPASRIGWVAPFVTDVWKYFKQAYGSCAVPRTLPAPIGPGCESFGAPKPLIALMRGASDLGSADGTAMRRFESGSGFRNTIAVGGNGWDYGMRDVIVHEACHIVEGASQGVEESPAFQVWGDSRWADGYCMYDFYARTGRTADAYRVFDRFAKLRFDQPAGAKDAHWFTDWFFPLWRDHGGNPAVMDRFFGLLSKYFPKHPENDGRSLRYDRRMTTGEFVHFASGAAGVDLSGQAAFAFNTGFNRAEFEKAKVDFPAITYAPAACMSGSVPCQPIRVPYPGKQTFTRVGPAPVRLTATSPTAGDTLRYTASGLPASVSIDSATGVISGAPTGPSGTGMATVTVSGRGNNTGKTSFAWTVADRFGAIIQADGDCVDVDMGLSANGTAVLTWGCHSPLPDNQTWTIDGQRFSALGKCMSTKDGGTADGTRVVLWDCDGSRAQRWTTDLSAGTIRNAAANKCLTRPDNVGQLTISSCTDPVKQRWRLPEQTVTVTPPGDQTSLVSAATSLQIQASTTSPGARLTYTATGLPPGLAIDSPTGRISGTPTTPGRYTVQVTARLADNDLSATTFTWMVADRIGAIIQANGSCVDVNTSQTANGTVIQTVPCASPPVGSQIWAIGDQRISALGKCMSTKDGGTADGTGVVLWDCDGSHAQRWQVDARTGTIRNVTANKCLTPPDGWAQITIATCTGATNQKWKLPA